MGTEHGNQGGSGGVSRSGAAVPGGDLTGEQVVGKVENLPLLMIRTLRGRWPLALSIAAVLGPGLAALGWMSTEAQYASWARLEVRSERVAASGQSELSGEIRWYHDAVRAEAERLKSAEVQDRALADEELRARGFPEGEIGRFLLRQGIAIDVPPGKTITVEALHEDPETAAVMVNALIRAYQAEESESQRVKAEDVLAVRRQRELELKAEVGRLEAEAQPLYDRYGTPALIADQLAGVNRSMAESVELSRELQTSVQRLDESFAARSELIASYKAGKVPGGAGPKEDQLALEDQKLASLDEQLRLLTTRMQQDVDRGLGPSHPVIVRAQEDIDLVTRLRGERVSALIEAWWVRQERELVRTGEERSEALRRIADQEARRSELSAERADLLARQQQVAEVAGRIDEAARRLASVRDSIEPVQAQLETVESETFALTRVMEWAKPSWIVAKDSRKTRAAAGLVFGAGLGIGGVGLLGLMKRRYRYIDDVRTGTEGLRCLGAIPTLAGDQHAETMEVYGAIDHVRGLIELDEPSRGSSVLTVTSAGVGEGKSTIARALAASFARAGHRTLLVDADPFGRATTRRLGVEGREGFADCLSSPGLEGVCQTGVPRLWVMPAGSPEGPASASLSSVERLVRDLRGDFDRVVIDTGPLFGTLEANLVARASDGVVLVVARGQKPGEVQKTAGRLREIGVKIYGVIFNRADPQDYLRTSAPASHVSRRSALAGDMPVSPVAAGGGVASVYSGERA
jgi:capsular exopolysaccharide synthesis family protein